MMHIIVLILLYFSLHANSDEILFQPWDYSLPCWRIPAAVTTSAGRVIVFAEGRYSNGDGCYVPNATKKENNLHHELEDPCKGYYRNIFYKFSDDDGQTWSEIRKLAGTNTSCLTDPAPVFYEDPVTHETKVLVQYSAKGGTETWQHVSLDNGDTFDEGTLLNQQLGVGAGKRPGPAGGLYIPKSGRLMYAGYAGSFDPGVSVWYSDNGGEEWDLASVVGNSHYDTNKSFENVTESVLVSLPLSGNVLLSMRVDSSAPRRAALSVTSSSSVPPLFNESAAPSGAKLPSTSSGDMGSLLASGTAVYYSMALAPDQGRSHMTVLMSLDDASTWTHGMVVYEGPSAYSDLTTLTHDEQSLGIAYERDAEDSSTCKGESCIIVFTSIPKNLPPYHH